VGTAATPTATHFAGIDVSKDTLDAALLGPDGRTRRDRFANAPAGFTALRAWADRHAGGGAVHFCLEATGPYSAALAEDLHAAGRHVSVANPARVSAYRRACGQANKTDPADARGIAAFARDQRPRAWVPPSPAVRQARALVRRRDDLRRMAAAEKNRLDAPDLTPAARRSVARVLKLLSREADRVQAQAEAVIDADPRLAADCALLESVQGVGRQTATTVLAELPPVDLLPCAQSAAAACGLSPREFTSGKTVRKHTRLSKAGNARLRTALYLPTLTAIRFNPVLRAFYARLVAAGKPKMQAVGACMRKLVMICYGVLRNRTPFDPRWAGVRPAAGGSPDDPPAAGRTPRKEG
jgi:transposase